VLSVRGVDEGHSPSILIFPLTGGTRFKGDTPLKSPAKRGSTPLDSPKGEKGIVTVVSDVKMERLG